MPQVAICHFGWVLSARIGVIMLPDEKKNPIFSLKSNDQYFLVAW